MLDLRIGSSIGSSSFAAMPKAAPLLERGITRTLPTLGVENVMCESDYPHGDGTWPDTQQVIHDMIGHLPAEQIRQLTHENAAKLYRHPLPEQRLP